MTALVVNTWLHMSEPSNSRPRPYRMTRRREAVQQTRERITAAAFELHATIGPSRTTVRAIAERAGVQRHTVYAHFPDLDALYLACTEHGMRATAMPEPEAWTGIHDAAARLRHGLGELYSWYRANSRMLAFVLSDADPTAPAREEADPYEARMARIAGVLGAGWLDRHHPNAQLLDAVVRHAMAFETWRSLTRNGLADEQAVDLLVATAIAVADGSVRSRS